MRGLQTLFVDQGVNAASQLVVGDPDESPWLHQADIGCGVGGLQQAGQNILGNFAAGHESAHVTAFGDHAIDRLPLPRTECVITHIVIVETVGCRSDQ
jgi:hypothetical protein